MTAAERAELDKFFGNSEAGLSYRPTLTRLGAEMTGVRRIFEWGPGASTLLMLDLFPQAEIYGVEHNVKWMWLCEHLMSVEPRVRISHELIDAPQKNGCYVTAPLYHGEKFDLMFVDGRLRRDCLGIAHLCLNPGGVAVLHDARRSAYHPALRFYLPTEITDNTAILRPVVVKA